MSDLRRHRRVSPGHDAPVTVDINGEDFVDRVNAEDVSLGGLRIRVSHGFAGCGIDDAIDLVITLPSPVRATIKANGRIKHLTGNTFGINFLSLSESAEHRLAKYIAYRSRTNSLWSRARFYLRIY